MFKCVNELRNIDIWMNNEQPADKTRGSLRLHEKSSINMLKELVGLGDNIYIPAVLYTGSQNYF